MALSAKTVAATIARELRADADRHAYAAEQLYAHAERASLFLDGLSEEDLAEVQAFLLRSAQREVELAYAALDERRVGL